MSALLLDDALLKCVVTQVVSFSLVALKTLTFHKIVWRHTWDVWWDLLWWYYYKFSPGFNSEISLTIGQYLTKFRRTKNVPVFLGPPCISPNQISGYTPGGIDDVIWSRWKRNWTRHPYVAPALSISCHASPLVCLDSRGTPGELPTHMAIGTHEVILHSVEVRPGNEFVLDEVSASSWP